MSVLEQLFELWRGALGGTICRVQFPPDMPESDRQAWVIGHKGIDPGSSKTY